MVRTTQRGEVTVALRSTRVVWIEDVVAMIEGAASSELYALLKRQDEKGGNRTRLRKSGVRGGFSAQRGA